MLRLFGIPNCDQVKKARQWLDAHERAYAFVNFREHPPTPAQIDCWLQSVSWQTLLNTRSTTWRSLDPAIRQVADREQAIALMCAHPTLIKRPILQSDTQCWVGFTETDYERIHA